MTRINPNETYDVYADDEVADKEANSKNYSPVRNFRQKAKFFTLTSTEGKMEVMATNPGVGELVQTLRTLDIPMLSLMEDHLVEDLVALQASNGLKLKTAYGQDVLVLYANSVEQVGRKIAKMLMNI